MKLLTSEEIKYIRPCLLEKIQDDIAYTILYYETRYFGTSYRFNITEGM